LLIASCREKKGWVFICRITRDLEKDRRFYADYYLLVIFRGSQTVYSPTHVLALESQIIVLVSAKVLEYLFVVRVVRIFFKPAQ
jgi:hypothetical protein